MTVAIVLGGAACLHEDMQAAFELFAPDVVIAVKDIGITYPHIDHWVTYHPERLPKELAIRRSKGLADPLFVWTYDKIAIRPKIGIEFRTVKHRGGSSGFMGMAVACIVADRAVLCGIPMDPKQKHFSRPKKQGWPEATYYRRVWSEHHDEYKDRVRSMSGWTKEIFGAPTQEWLAHGAPGQSHNEGRKKSAAA
jgi:hypothetical protein